MEFHNGAATDELLSRRDSSGGQAVFYVHDHLGSVRALTDASGDVVEHYRYDAFGRPSVSDASGNELPRSAYGNRFMFTGREYLAHAGLYDFRNRTYSPRWGRFIEVDPIRFEGGDLNMYRYVGNGVLNWVDLWGLAVTNNTDHTIYVKDEKDSTVHSVPPGETWLDAQDGFCDPDHPGQVYKTVDGVDATLNADGSVSLSELGDFFLVVEHIFGELISRLESWMGRDFDNSGWYGKDYVDHHSDWENLYNASFNNKKDK